MRNLYPVIALFLTSIIVTHAQNTHASRSAFESASSSLNTLTFEGLISTSSYPENYLYGFGHVVSGPATISVNDATFLSNESFIVSPTEGASIFDINGSTVVLLAFNSSRVNLSGTKSALGFDYGRPTNATQTHTIQATFYLSGSSVYSTSFSYDDTSNFFGVTGFEFDRVDFLRTAGDGNYLVLDNLAYGVSSIPEPKTTAGLIGIITFAIVSRRRITLSASPPP